MRKIISFVLLLMALLVPVWAEETDETTVSAEPTEIHTVDDLYAMAQSPEGSYILSEDLDMEGQNWVPFAFFGTLDGNGHSILNLALSEPGSEIVTALDGNQKEYDAVYCGLFSTLQNAEVRNLNLVNIRGLIETAQPCFAGPIAGYCMDSTINDCTVSGQLELRAYNGIFGLGGFVGYGVGDIVGCAADMTLICVDTDESTMDEQFLGGAFATGFMTVTECTIKLDAYISEHGYVHSGGVVGMLMQYPIGMGHSAMLTDNTIDASISFFEHNRSRRAYCGKVYGELMKSVNFNYRITDNEGNLQKNETSDYSRELRPETCAEPDYRQTVVPSDCTHFGYTEYVCQGCGYTYRDNYRLHSHSVSSWTVVIPATTQTPGESIGKCNICGAEQTREDPILSEPETEPETEPITEPETEPPTEAPTTMPQTESAAETETAPETLPEVESETKEKGPSPWIPWLLGIVALGLAVSIGHMLSYKPQHAKKRRK